MSDFQLQNYIQDVFRQFDRDGQGYLDVSELEHFFDQVLRRMGDFQGITPTEAQQIMTMVDLSRDRRCAKDQLFFALKYLTSYRRTNRGQGNGGQKGGGAKYSPSQPNEGWGYQQGSEGNNFQYGGNNNGW